MVKGPREAIMLSHEIKVDGLAVVQARFRLWNRRTSHVFSTVIRHFSAGEMLRLRIDGQRLEPIDLLSSALAGNIDILPAVVVRAEHEQFTVILHHGVTVKRGAWAGTVGHSRNFRHLSFAQFRAAPRPHAGTAQDLYEDQKYDLFKSHWKFDGIIAMSGNPRKITTTPNDNNNDW